MARKHYYLRHLICDKRYFMIHLEIQLFLIRLHLAKSFDNCKICADLAFAGFFLTIIVFLYATTW